MGWEELIDALDELETEVKYDGYFCSIQDAVIIVTLGSMCELKSVMRIYSWATTETVSTFLAQAFGIRRIQCYSWLLELLALIKPDSLNRCMMKFVASLCPDLIAELEKEQEKQAAKLTHALYRYILRRGVWLNINRVSLKIQIYIFRRFPTLLLTHSSIMTTL